MGHFNSRSAVVNHVVGHLSVGLHRGVVFGVGGRHMKFAYSGGAISLAAIGRSHFWGTAAKLKCVHAHCFGWSSASSILLPGVYLFSDMGRVGGLAACVLGFALVLGVAFCCRGLTVLLIVCCDCGILCFLRLSL
jgi:hypothetical protein